APSVRLHFPIEAVAIISKEFWSEAADATRRVTLPNPLLLPGPVRVRRDRFPPLPDLPRNPGSSRSLPFPLPPAQCRLRTQASKPRSIPPWCFSNLKWCGEIFLNDNGREVRCGTKKAENP